MTSAATSLAGCSVCGEAEPDPRMLQDCFECGNPFHINPRSVTAGPIACGLPWQAEQCTLPCPF